MDFIDEQIYNAYKDSILNERKFDLNSGTMGNGIVVWNRAKEVHGDYEKIAHIDTDRKIKYFIKNPPKDVVKYVEKIAKGKNFSISTSQKDKMVFKEGKQYLNEASPIKFEELDDDSKKKLVVFLVGKSDVNNQNYFDGIHGQIVSFINQFGSDAIRLNKNDLKKIIQNKKVRWVDVRSIGF